MSDIVGHNEPLQRVICNECKHYRRSKPGTCAAFPNRIPSEIIRGDNDHSKPLPGQGNDIVFERAKVRQVK